MEANILPEIHKVGHNCKDNPPRKPKKKWQQKVPKKVDQVEAKKKETPQENGAESWTNVEKQRKGKFHVVEEVTPTFDCDNVFDALKLLNEPLVIIDIT